MRQHKSNERQDPEPRQTGQRLIATTKRARQVLRENQVRRAAQRIHPECKEIPQSVMPYHIVSQHENGGYRCEIQKPDLPSAISFTLTKVKEARRRHYIVDEQGKLVDIIHPN
jgi:hypothetical protein